jgi:hypothetical protein
VTRHNHPEIEAEKSSSNKLLEDSNNNEITIDYRGEKISKNRYFFGDILHKTGATTTSSGPSSGTSGNSGRTGAKSRLGFLKEGINYTNILRAPFLYKIMLKTF